MLWFLTGFCSKNDKKNIWNQNRVGHVFQLGKRKGKRLDMKRGPIGIENHSHNDTQTIHVVFFWVRGCVFLFQIRHVFSIQPQCSPKYKEKNSKHTTQFFKMDVFS